MTRISFLLFIPALFSQCVCSFVVVNGASSLSHVKSDAAVETTPKTPFRIPRDKKKQQPQKEEPFSSSQLLTEQVAREFTTARRYLFAAGAVEEMSEHFFAAEEEQRMRAMQVMEYARIHGIALADYQGQIQTTPIDQTLAPADFVRELLLQEQRDSQLLEKALAAASSSSLHNSDDLVHFLQSIRTEHLDRQQEIVQLLTQVMPTDMHHKLILLADSVSSNAAASTATATTTTPSTDVLASRLENIHSIQQQLPKSGAAAGDNLSGSVNHHHSQQAWGVVTGALPEEIQTALRHLERLPSSHYPVAHVTAAGAVATAVDTDALPSTEEILDALPIDTEVIMEVVDALPSTEDILDALPIDTEVILEVVDNAATFLEEQSELVDNLQQNLMDTETLSQIADIVSQLNL